MNVHPLGFWGWLGYPRAVSVYLTEQALPKTGTRHRRQWPGPFTFLKQTEASRGVRVAATAKQHGGAWGEVFFFNFENGYHTPPLQSNANEPS